MIQPLLPQPLRLTSRIQRRERQTLPIPAQHIRIQFQRETRLRIILRLHMQSVQLVNVPQIHFLPIDLILVEIQQIHRARHSLVAILFTLDDAAIVQQSFEQTRHRRNKRRSGRLPWRLFGQHSFG